ncbi:uncharacterized protein (DUF305 family) [Glaciihabitans tibetensis]|uniref:Uncharacterized protein (DUF305 family) n=1 Tax=Glaciihabitans tibetensis TaxID=1266600 RepID=A0A2T0V5I3_9MICO|nr:DUF305 domain-containing protein [Glaciihabitans tibetensis]PRY65414.1 uncharacterized protein (DUF305 family) [Glaciihabitans tibetensis]
MHKSRFVLFAAGVIAGTLLLAGCSAGTNSSSETSPAPSATADQLSPFNDSDVAFAMGMVEHHEQAIVMADAVLDKDNIDPRVTELAQNITDAQGPEIDLMNDWIASWDVEKDDMSDMDHGMAMTDDDMTALEEATGADASELFLTQMTEHHNGAIEMAQTELDAGENPDALALAQQIIDAQTAEIATMKALNAEL